MNKTIILGNLSRDIEKKEITKSGEESSFVYTSAIAHTRKFKKRDGTMGKEVMFLDIAFFGRLGENAFKFFKKGHRVLLEGRLKFSQWPDKENPPKKRSKHSLIVESFKIIEKREKSSEESSVVTNQKEEPQQESLSDYSLDSDNIEKDGFFPQDY